MIYISSLESKITIYQARKAWIALLFAKKVTVLAKYLDIADMFLEELANVLSEQIEINKHVIVLEKDKQRPYELIYSLRLVEFETFKTYIKINLANSSIRTSKLQAGTLIVFVHKPNSSFCLCVNYSRLNNLVIKNWYPLPLIGMFLDWLSQDKEFTKLNLTSVYYWIKIKKGDKWKTAFRNWYRLFNYQVMLFGLFNLLASF